MNDFIQKFIKTLKLMASNQIVYDNRDINISSFQLWLEARLSEV